MISKEKISIITPVFNGINTMQNTICSVLGQQINISEYIVIDNCSHDGTSELVDSYKNITHIRESDKGIYDAMNKWIEKSSWEIIGIINSDDAYTSNAIEKVLNIFKAYPEVDIVHWNIRSIQRKWWSFIEKPFPEKFLYFSMCIKHPTCFVRKKVYNEIWRFDLKFKVASDYDFLLRAYLAGKKFFYLDDVITNFQRWGFADKNKHISIIEHFKVRKKNGCALIILIWTLTPIYGVFIRSIKLFFKTWFFWHTK